MVEFVEKSYELVENKEPLEVAVFKWFLQQRAEENPLSRPCEKVKIFAEKIEGLSSSKATNGWLWNFKARNP